MSDLSKCQCSAPGFCPVFKVSMGTSPPDWEWCQRANKEDRESYFKITKELNSHDIEVLRRYNSLGFDDKYFYLYALMHDKAFHVCSIASEEQDRKFTKIIKLLEQEDSKENNIEDVEILLLSHKEEQLTNFIPCPSYLKKTNLSKIEAGLYSGNEWAESRAYFSTKPLFSKKARFTGTVTCSWNQKYMYNRIDKFNKWQQTKILLNSQPEDNIVLCADVFCPCCWTISKPVLNVFYEKDTAVESALQMLKDLDITLDKHVRVPFGHQFIAHKHIFEHYSNFLKQKNVAERVKQFLSENDSNLRRGTHHADKYHNIRINAYMMEFISCFYFAKQNYFYIPTDKRRNDWYSKNKVEQRIQRWDMTT